MFPRAQRLSKRRDIQAVLTRGRLFHSPGLIMRVLPTQESNQRITVVVGTVVDKRAVVRNRVKRQIRHLLREILKDAPKMLSFDMMVTVKKALLEQSPAFRREQLLILLRRAGVLKYTPPSK